MATSSLYQRLLIIIISPLLCDMILPAKLQKSLKHEYSYSSNDLKCRHFGSGIFCPWSNFQTAIAPLPDKIDSVLQAKFQNLTRGTKVCSVCLLYFTTIQKIPTGSAQTTVLIVTTFVCHEIPTILNVNLSIFSIASLIDTKFAW